MTEEEKYTLQCFLASYNAALVWFRSQHISIGLVLMLIYGFLALLHDIHKNVRAVCVTGEHSVRGTLRFLVRKLLKT